MGSCKQIRPLEIIMRNFKIIVEYDGAAYCGWQRQNNGVSIQQILEEAIGLITGAETKLIGSGRTDAGVHAINQVANFRSKTLLPAEKLFRGINSVLPPDIVVKSLEEVNTNFHAQRDVKSKVYVYRIYNKSLRSAFGRNYFWFVRHPLDVNKMRQAAEMLIGTNDFSCFCATGTDVTDRIRTIIDVKIEETNDGMIEIALEAKGFLKYMARIIVGTLVEIGRNKRLPQEMKRIIDSRDRNNAGMTAPACGLFLKEVKYN